MSSSLFADFYIDYDENSKPLPEKYYIYAEDRKGSYLVLVYNSEKCDEVISKLQKIISGKYHPKWAKKYTYSDYLGPLTNGIYKDYKAFDIPLVQFTITHGKYNWDTAVHLILNLNTRKMYYDKNRINLHHINNPSGNIQINLSEEWDNKLNFIKKN